VADIDLRAGTDTVRQDFGDDLPLFFPVLDADGVELDDLSGITFTLEVEPADDGWTTPVEVEVDVDGSPAKRAMTFLDGDDMVTREPVLTLRTDDPDYTVRYVRVHH